jgi:preprotein translocase subunit SecE
VARDRKRAKQRRARGGGSAGAAARSAQATTPNQPVREDVPGALDHASGDVDEFDAALVRGAGGVPVAPDGELDLPDPAEAVLGDDELQEPAGPGGPPQGPRRGGGGGDDGHGEPGRPSGAPLRGGNRAIGFLAASWAELQRVQWPDRRQVTQATAVVLGFVAIAGAYLGLADFVAKEIVEFIL